MRKFFNLFFLSSLLLMIPRSKAQYSPLEDYREEVNLNKKSPTDRNTQKIIEINIADLPESDADKNKIQKGYDNLVAAVQTKSGEEVNKVLDKLDILTKQKVLHRFIQNYKKLQVEGLTDAAKGEAPQNTQEGSAEQKDE